MSLRSVVFLLFLLLLANIPARAEEQILNGVAAIVNSDVITFAQVQEMIGTRERALAGQFQGAELDQKTKELRLAAVHTLIDNQLILQEFAKNKFSIPDYVVNEQIQSRIKDQFGGDRAAFIRTLEAQGLTMDRFRKMVRDDIIVQAMRQRSVKDDTIISPEKIEQYYKQNIEEYSTPEQVKLRMIVIKKNGQTGRQMAEEVRQKVLGGADFDKLAQMYSEDSTQESGGDWGWVDRRTLNESLTKIAFSLKPGDVSEVVELAGSYYLLYVEAKKNATSKAMAEVHDDIENKLLAEQRQKAEEKWLDSLRHKAYISIPGITDTEASNTASTQKHPKAP